MTLNGTAAPVEGNPFPDLLAPRVVATQPLRLDRRLDSLVEAIRAGEGGGKRVQCGGLGWRASRETHGALAEADGFGWTNGCRHPDVRTAARLH